MSTSYACAAVVISELVRHGVTEVVMAPGSRNAPLSFALLVAERDGQLRVHVRIDERSAGFVALGLAKVSFRPVAMICTSGTAVGNLHPAVIEAHESNTPLIVITANRPRRLWGTGANQTIDQVGIFSSAVRAATHLAADADGEDEWRRITEATVIAATGDRPGPVQLDIGFAEPLLPDDDQLGAALTAASRDLQLPQCTPCPVAEISAPPRTLVFIGEASAKLAMSAATAAGNCRFPVHIEAGTSLVAGQADLLDGGAWLLADEAFLDRFTPEHVVVIGRPTLARSLNKLLARTGVSYCAVSDHGEWSNPNKIADIQVIASEVSIIGAAQTDFADGWRQGSMAATAAVSSHSAADFDAGAVADLVGRSNPDLLIVGSSNPIRDLDQRLARSMPRNVVVNRGAAGIDGLVSTAVGAALAVAAGSEERAARRCVALLGDLAFLHDSNGLILGPDEPRPALTIVVSNNDGGAIFASLEQGAQQYAASYERIFGTPHGVNIEALCAACGIAYHSADDRQTLRELLQDDPDSIRVIVVRVDRQGERERRTRLKEHVEIAVESNRRQFLPRSER